MPLTRAGSLDAVIVQTAASLREMIANVDLILKAVDLRPVEIERAYVVGREDIAAGDRMVFQELDAARLLAEIAQAARNRLAEVAKKMEIQSALGSTRTLTVESA